MPIRFNEPENVVTAAPLPWDDARVGKCYNNVNEMVKRRGGQLAYGWALTDFGPHRRNGLGDPPPLYRRWLNHVLWRDTSGQLWEVTPNTVIDNHKEWHFAPTIFLPDVDSTFEIITDDEWFTQPTRYVAVRPEGSHVAKLLTNAQHATGDARDRWLQQALAALEVAGFQAREWKVEIIGNRTGSIWLIAD